MSGKAYRVANEPDPLWPNIDRADKVSDIRIAKLLHADHDRYSQYSASVVCFPCVA